MQSTPPPSEFDPRFQPREREAKTVAGLFRSSRLTLLLGEEGAGKTTLLKASVLPLMERRATNLTSAMMAHQRVVAPSPDRREPAGGGRNGGTNAGRYATVLFDRWDEAPLAGLRTAIDEASRQFADRVVEPGLTLADTLIAFARERRVHFLIVLDRFEAFLAAPDSNATREFTDQLVAALNTPFLPANFLISMRDDAEPLLEPLARRVPGFGDARLRVLPVRRATESVEPAGPAQPRVKQGESLISRAYGSPPLDFDITTGAAESAATIATEHALDHPSDRTPVAEAAPKAAASEIPPTGRLGDLLTPPVFDSGNAVPRAHPAPARRRWSWVAGAIAAGALLLVVVANRPERGAPEPSLQPKSAAQPPESGAPAASHKAAPSTASAPASRASTATVSEPPPAAEPTPATTPAPAPGAVPGKSAFTIVVDAENGTATRMANDLARAVARDGLVVDVRATGEPAADLVAETHGEPRLIIARRDAMEAARRSNDSAMAPEAARILMPLFTEGLYFIVRVDSPLRFVHQIENKRINIGAPNGARARTARSAYQAMFGKALPAAAGGALDLKHALDALTRDRSIDAIVLVAAEPAPFLTTMPRPMRERIKLLRLEGGDPAERRALRSYLPATLHEDANRVLPYQNIQTLAVMSFLLASPPADPAGAERLKAFANSLCRNLPALRRQGDPRWRQVRPGAALNIEWPDAGAAAASLRACEKRSTAEARRTRKSQKSRRH